MKRKLMCMLLVLVVVLTGCGKINNTNTTSTSNTSSNSETKEDVSDSDVISQVASSGDISFAELLHTSYASSTVTEDYESPMYSLDPNYVFEFDADESLSSYTYKAFEVHARPDFSDINIAKCDYFNGKIRVYGNNGIEYNETGATNTADNWGSYNKLYLVQYLDLETGDELSRPIVTPFSVKHDLASPVVTQSVGEGNLWTLSWTPVEGASKYIVYASFNDTGDSVTKQCETTDTTITVSDLDSQKKSDNYTDLLYNDLENAGYSVERGTSAILNNKLRVFDQFVVVAFDNNGRQSGVSNVVNVDDIAGLLPYNIIATTWDVNINTIYDVPAYVDVEMLDGSAKKMLIDYHGAQTFKDPDNPYFVGVQPHVCNTDFSVFNLKLHGMRYDDFIAQVSEVTTRQDSLNTSGGGVDMNLTLPSSPDSSGVAESNEQAEAIVEELEIVSEETSEEEMKSGDVDYSKLVELPDASGATTYDLYLEAASVVEERLQQIPDIHSVIYADNQLEAWIAYALVTNLEIIPVPTAVYPEVSNEEYLVQIFMEAYSQNPTSGMITDLGYSYEYESLIPVYAEDYNTRMSKTSQELAKAKQLASELSGSDRDKVYAINKYLCDNAEYDFDSTETNLQNAVLSESFIDAHTPYGVLCKNYGVCESYAESFALIARFSGINALIETGYMDGGAHEWNRVNVDGSWCIVDVTNNDVELFDGSLNALLNVTDAQISENFVIDGQAHIASLPATYDGNEYYNVNSMVAKDISQAAEIAAQQMKSNGYAQVRLDFYATDSDIQKIAPMIYEESGVMPESYVYTFGVLIIV